MFNKREFFPHGVDPTNVEVRVADGKTVPADGVGTAVVWSDKANTWITHRNALMVLGLAECLVSTAQAYSQAGVQCLLEPQMRLVFPTPDGPPKNVPLDPGYTLTVRSPTPKESRRLAGEDDQPGHVITRGRTPGRNTANLPVEDACRLWRCRDACNTSCMHAQ